DGADLAALNTRAWQYSQSAKEWSRDEHVRRQEHYWFAEGHRPLAVTRNAIVGSVETLVEKIAECVVEGDYDWMALYLPDYIADLEILGREVLPRLVKAGVGLQHTPQPRLTRAS